MYFVDNLFRRAKDQIRLIKNLRPQKTEFKTKLECYSKYFLKSLSRTRFSQ